MARIWNAKGDFSEIDTRLGTRESEIFGLPRLSILVDANDWEKLGEAGQVYPAQYRIYRKLAGAFGMERDFDALQWVLVDETGWDGFEQVPAEVIGLFASYEAANQARALLLTWSDPLQVFEVVCRFVRKDASFRELRGVIDWRDLRGEAVGLDCDKEVQTMTHDVRDEASTIEAELLAYRNEAEHDRQTIEAARRRVADEPLLAAHADTICYDWDEGMSHWEWVLSAPVSVIVEWAEYVEHDETAQDEYLADEAADLDARLAPYFDNEAEHDGL